MSTIHVANHVLWGVWQVDTPRPVAHGAVDHQGAPTED
jgi:hypothetical protein